MQNRILALFLFLFLPLSFAFGAPADLRTVAEMSGWLKTGRADETERLCKAFAKKYPSRVKCKSYGKTPEGRTLSYLTVADRSATSKTPTIWAQAGIHAGEIDGKDAVFWLMREALEGKIQPDPFRGMRFVFIPIVNLDGHERFGKWNRPNQVGPEEMGWRTTAQNYNLNRDFAKVDAPEMQALNRLWGEVDPIISLDLHVTNGAQFQPEIGVVIEPNDNRPGGPLHLAGKALELEMMEKMKARGSLALPFYPTFENEDEPLSGFSRYVATPRFSHAYWYERNRIGILVESHSWKNYATRVKAHYNTVLSVLESAQKHGKGWLENARQADQANLAGAKVDLEFKHSEKFRTIEFPGYKFKIETSKIAGNKVIRYFPDQPEVWKVPFYEEIVPALTVVAPREGYFVPPSEAAWLKPKLDVHRIRYTTWKKTAPETLKVFRATKTELSKNSFEGHQTLAVEGEWSDEKTPLPSGSLFIPIRQPQARLILHLFEPLAKDSFLAWGFLNRAFERKEYMESYVTEDIAAEMLARRPEIRNEFNRMLKDPEFAKDPQKRLDFFYKKHPSWDERYNRYPIFKL